MAYSLLGQNSCRQSGNRKLKIAVLSNCQWLSGTKSSLTVYKIAQIWLQKEAMESLPLEASKGTWRRERARAHLSPGAMGQTGELLRGPCRVGTYFL